MRKNTAFRATHINPTVVEDKKIERLNEKLIHYDEKIQEYKLEMEKFLLQKEEAT